VTGIYDLVAESGFPDGRAIQGVSKVKIVYINVRSGNAYFPSL
jgi:hypothetical protein